MNGPNQKTNPKHHQVVLQIRISPSVKPIDPLIEHKTFQMDKL
jgi:hypothetical protein